MVNRSLCSVPRGWHLAHWDPAVLPGNFSTSTGRDGLLPRTKDKNYECILSQERESKGSLQAV